MVFAEHFYDVRDLRLVSTGNLVLAGLVVVDFGSGGGDILVDHVLVILLLKEIPNQTEHLPDIVV